MTTIFAVIFLGWGLINLLGQWRRPLQHYQARRWRDLGWDLFILILPFGFALYLLAKPSTLL